MDQKDKKEIIKMMGGALEDIVLPRLQNIEDDIVDIKKTLREHTIKFDDIEETLGLHTNQLDGINRRLDLEADKRGELEWKVDNHEKRLTKVETKVA